MNCSECSLLLLDCHYDTLDTLPRVAVDQHLAGCEKCRATLAKLQVSVPDQLSWPDEDPPTRLAERTARKALLTAERAAPPTDPADGAPKARIVPLPVKGRPRSPLRTVLKIAAAIALLAVGGWYAWSHQRRVALVATVDGQEQLAPGTLTTLRMSVFDVDTQKPIADAHLKVLLKGPDNKETVIYDGPSDRFGTLSGSTRLPDLPEGGYTLLATASKSGESTSVSRAVTLARHYRLMLASDKPTYQPGQTIHVRALARESATGRPPEGRELSFTVLDAKGNKVGRKSAKVDKFGVASMDFALADEILLGSWKVQAELANVTSDLDLSVARYTLPKFEVKCTPDKPWYKPGEVVSGRVESRYFFGKPVAGAKVKVTAGVFVDTFRAVATAEGVADPSGTWGFELALPRAVPGLSLTQGSAAVDLKLEVLDQAGERVEKHHALMVAESEMSVTAVPEGGVLVRNAENRVLVLVVRPDGEPVTGAKVTLPASEGGPQSGITGEDGIATVSYRTRSDRRDLPVQVVGTDGIRLDKVVEVASEALPGVVRTERTIYTAGETVEGEILTVSPAGVAFLDVVRDGNTISTLSVPLAGSKGTFTFDLPAESAGTVTLYAYTPGKDTKRSRKTLFVGEPRSLKVSLSADAETFRPGKEARLTLKVAGDDGKPAAASVGVSIVDESVFALAAKEPALLKAYFLLAEELSKPRYELDPAQVVSDPRRDRAANLLFSYPRDPEVRRVAQTDDQELSTRRASLLSSQQTNTRASWGLGLLLVGVLFEGILRLFFEKIFAPLFKGRWWRSGALLLGAGVGIYCKAVGLDESTCLLAGLAPLAATAALELFVHVLNRFSIGFTQVTVVFVLIIIAAVAVITFFGQNLRALFAASANALGGSEDSSVTSAGSAGYSANTRRKNISNFGTNATGDEGGGYFPAAAPQVVSRPIAAKEESKMGALEPQLQNALAPATAAEKAKVRVRSWFPETMFWSPGVITGADGMASLSVPVADSITSWRISATASAADGRLGVGTSALKVFQDFFVDIDLPVALTVGDEIEVPIAVHNYLGAAQAVKLEVEAGDWFEALSPKVQLVELGADEVKGVPLKLRATSFGRKTLTVYAFGSKLNDALKREVEVRPDGVVAETAVGGVLGSQVEHVTASLPPGTIAGSEKVLLRIFPGLFASAVEGLEGVLRMPSGCFEQTSSATFPNVLVLDYLRRSRTAKPDVEARAIEFIQQGYQRLLSYEVKGGGFEWFGRAPANQVLTAYGLLEFADMARVYEIDPAVIRRTQEWLVSRQGVDGSWSPDSQSLADGLYRDDFSGRAGTTAYLAWALAESGYRGPALDRALSFLISRTGEAKGAYLKALVANALVVGGREGSAGELFDELERSAVEESGKVHFPAGARTAMYSGGGAADVEATALSALALSRAGRMTKVRPAFDWLLSHRDGHGAWASTQATVLALRALLSAAAGGQDQTADAQVIVKWPGEAVQKMAIKPESSDLVQTVDLTRYAKPGRPMTVEVSMEGTARAQYQLVTRAWVPKPAKLEALSLKVDYDRVSLAPDDTITGKATASWNREGPSGMVMIALGIPPGFEVEAESVGRLVAAGKVGKFTLTGKELLLYVDGLKTRAPVEYSYKLRARFPVKAKAPAAMAYLYYQPEVKAEAGPVALLVHR